MPLVKKWKLFGITADNTNILANDPVLGSTGKGRYAIWPAAAAAADGTITVSDGFSDVLPTMFIPVRAAAVTYPEIKRNEDRPIVVDYRGAADTVPINIVDGTNGEIAVLVEFLG